MKVAITGGHHSSAVPVIKELKKLDPNVTIWWFGHKYSLKGDKNPTLEYLDITALDIKFINLHAGKVYKTFDITRLLKVPYGFFEALSYLSKFKPDVIVSFGGYLAVPVVVAGWFLGIPSITHEQTLVAGYANKVISRFVNKIFISWPQSQKYFDESKVEYSGLPIREDVYTVSSNNFELDTSLPTIYVTAGKTGSHKMNEVVKGILPELLNISNVIMQCGDNSVFNDYDAILNNYKSLAVNCKGKFYLRKFVRDDEIGEVFNKSDLLISRSGAHIISEILLLQKPAILIPISWVSHNEQYINAQYVKDVGLGIILEEKNFTCENLLDTIKETLKNLANYKIKSHFIPENKASPQEVIAHEIIKYKVTK
ncbi:MAG TPA: UDP-N-acetylglucosamine--N-acetylmuramyl-(pentapeptide) pyrophosphoryl-undecaprenol N-acetylglucosamine transferase [Candidatus Saccharimonadales bacterium]|nr:UDP-N-acetylglucosamine--N-acetylmuramyl-(pentapeptide) pyrophosphoryl-undecaprenol N-acetylglucosamine transferase [Candidatus Saccharimonadales bacterium]